MDLLLELAPPETIAGNRSAEDDRKKARGGGGGGAAKKKKKKSKTPKKAAVEADSDQSNNTSVPPLNQNNSKTRRAATTAAVNVESKSVHKSCDDLGRVSDELVASSSAPRGRSASASDVTPRAPPIALQPRTQTVLASGATA